MVLKRAIAKTDTPQASFMNKKYIVRLTPEEQHYLEELISSGKAAARKLTHARILLKANCEGEQGEWTDQAIHQALDVSLSTIACVRHIDLLLSTRLLNPLRRNEFLNVSNFITLPSMAVGSTSLKLSFLFLAVSALTNVFLTKNLLSNR